MNSARIRRDLQQIWQAGIDAVRADRLLQNAVQVDGNEIRIAGTSVPLADLDRIVVVGGGKAGGHMAAGFEAAVDGSPFEKLLSGWVNVPDDCIRPTKRIHLNAARPAGRNEPTAEGVAGSEKILEHVAGLTDRDLCVVQISGGGSALMPAPVTEVTLADKLAITRMLSGAGANIHELNSVRRQLSRIKGGGLLRACSAGRIITLIISDVLGDPLDVIASGPTVASSTTAADAIAVMNKYCPQSSFPAVMEFLRSKSKENSTRAGQGSASVSVENHILANNQTALDASAEAAKELGYETFVMPTDVDEPTAEQVAIKLVDQLRASAAKRNSGDPPLCILSGGEPTVRLAPEDRRGVGGRNQQLVLRALAELAGEDTLPAGSIGLLSGGSDGEDGPTDAAGAMIWPDLIHAARQSRLAMQHHLDTNDAWHFLGPPGALLRTGPTGTNVCDVRVMIVA